MKASTLFLFTLLLGIGFSSTSHGEMDDNDPLHRAVLDRTRLAPGESPAPQPKAIASVQTKGNEKSKSNDNSNGNSEKGKKSVVTQNSPPSNNMEHRSRELAVGPAAKPSRVAVLTQRKNIDERAKVPTKSHPNGLGGLHRTPRHEAPKQTIKRHGFF